MTTQNNYRYVLEQVAADILARAQEIKSRSAYDQGRLMGYYEALSEIVNQSRLAEIDPADIGIDVQDIENVLKNHTLNAA